VLRGQASFVTGGTPVNPKITGPGEIRADNVEGGTTRQLKPGDVVVVPKGTAHWFKKIDEAPFHYFVVKPIH
jgi:quercetin dioxygenase-like cupin family protein